MEELRYITYVSVFLCILLFYIDDISTRRKGQSRISNLGNFLYKTKRQTVAVYFISLLGIAVYPISIIFPEIFVNIFASVACCSMIGFISILAIGFARLREKKLLSGKKDWKRKNDDFNS